MNYKSKFTGKQIDDGIDKANSAYQKPQTGIPASDLSEDVQSSLGKARTAVQTETDPTVPEWAKNPTKPSYNAQEVGALPADTPLFDGDYNELINKPTKVSHFENDANYLTQHQSLQGYATEQWVRNQGYLTQHQDISGKEDKSNKVTSWQSTPDDTHYPSEKLVKDSIDGVDKFVEVEYGVTSYQEVVDAMDAGKLPIVYYNASLYIVALNNLTTIYFTCAISGRIYFVRVSEDGTWSNGSYILELTSNKKTTIAGNEASNTYYPTTKAVADYVEKKTDIVAPVNTTDATLPITTLTCEVGKYYRIDVAVDTLAITLPAITDLTTVRTVVICLTAGTTPAVTVSAADSKDVYYQDGFEIEAGSIYEINALFNGAAWIVAAVKINVE